MTDELEPYVLHEMTDLDFSQEKDDRERLSWFYRVEELGLVVGVIPPGSWDQLGGTPWFVTQGLWGDAERGPIYLVQGRSYDAKEARRQAIEWFNENRLTLRVRGS